MLISGSATSNALPVPEVLAVASPASEPFPFKVVHPNETVPVVLSKNAVVTRLDEKLLM
jgi:hypothetical protein